MPKVDIDYSNTIIYKICCKNPEIKDLYVGHTTNFVQRKYAHKQNCNNIKSPCYNLKLYKTIRDNGNWDNWEMSIVQFYNCKDLLDARQKEQEHFITLNATLNSIEPLSCNPNKGLKEPKIVLSNALNKEFICKACNFKCYKKGDLNRHNLTLKHCKNEQNEVKTYKHICNCGKEYSHRQGLSVHKKKCTYTQNTTIHDNELEMSDKDLIKQLIKDNYELKTMILETYKSFQMNNANSTNCM